MAKIWCGLLLLISIILTLEASGPFSKSNSRRTDLESIREHNDLRQDNSPTTQELNETKQKFPDDHYCKMDKEHFMCTTKGFNSFHLECEAFEMFPREDVRLELDTAFNHLRNAYALGHWPGDSFPMSIPNMQGLEWDDELADLAERWAQQCPSQTVQRGNVGRFNVTQIVAFSSGETMRTTQDVLAGLIRSNHTFHLKGPPSEKLNMLHTATSQYNKTKPMSILTNPHLRYFGCSVANMMQDVEKERQKTRFHRRLLNRKPSAQGGRSVTLKPPPPLPGEKTHKKRKSTGKNKHAANRKLNTSKEQTAGIQPTQLSQVPVETTTKLKKSYLHKTVIVCNFGPVEEPYEIYQEVGEPCSACPNSLTCFPESSYPGLCLENYVQQKPVRHKITVKPQLNETKKEEKEKCPIVCENGVPHILCRYNGSAEEFATVIPVSGPTTINYILVWHNLLRDAVASGRHHLQLPLAANMREMVWSKQLEQSAMAWAKQCLPYTDACQDERFPGDEGTTYVNQLVTRKPWNLDKDGFPSFEDDILSDWAKGFKYFTAADIKFFNPEMKKNGSFYDNFAQMIWAETYMVGCAMTLCRSFLEYEDDDVISTSNTMPTNHSSDDSVKSTYNSSADETFDSVIVAVCNYAPGGALEGEDIYIIGGSCTKCQKLKKDHAGTRGLSCSDEYFHLCSAQNVSLEGSKLNDFDSEAYKDIRTRMKRYIRKPAKYFRDEILFQLNVSTTYSNVTTISNVTETSNMTTRYTMTSPVRNTSSTKPVSTTTKPQTTRITSTAPRDKVCDTTHKCFEQHKIHTHCKYKKIAKFCIDHDIIINPLSSTRFLNLHNELRGLVAVGRVDEKSPFSKFPRAGNMRKMIWDSQLETSAKEWALQCMNGTDECRDRNYAQKCEPFEINRGDVPEKCLLRANQLVAEKEFDPSTGSATPSPEEFFTVWKDQVKKFDPTKLINTYIPDEKYDEFAQLIWARTFLVGCAYVSYDKHDINVSKVRIAKLVCNYAPAGLLEARSVYKIGGACTLCEKIYKDGDEGLYCSYPLGLCDRKNTH